MDVHLDEVNGVPGRSLLPWMTGSCSVGRSSRWKSLDAVQKPSQLLCDSPTLNRLGEMALPHHPIA